MKTDLQSLFTSRLATLLKTELGRYKIHCNGVSMLHFIPNNFLPNIAHLSTFSWNIKYFLRIMITHQKKLSVRLHVNHVNTCSTRTTVTELSKILSYLIKNVKYIELPHFYNNANNKINESCIWKIRYYIFFHLTY